MSIPFRPSASSLDRAIKCPASCIIPIRVTTENESAIRGTWIHKYIELIIEGLLPEAALYRIPDEYKDNCRRTNVDFLVGLHDVKSEISFAVDFVSGEVRYLGQGLGRDYPDVKDSEFTGTLDIYAKKDNECVLIDLKSGMTTTPCEHNYQIKFAAYALHKLYGHKTVDAYLMYLREGEDNIPDNFVFTDFDSILAEFQDFYKRLTYQSKQYEDNGVLDLHMGSHCEYCPASIACPAMVNAVRALSGKLGDKENFDDVAVSVSKLSNTQLAVAWTNYMKVKNYFAVAEKSLRSKIREVGGIKTDTFKVIPTECTRKSPDATKLLKLARKHGATDSEVDAAVSVVKFTRLKESPVKASVNNSDNIDKED